MPALQASMQKVAHPRVQTALLENTTNLRVLDQYPLARIVLRGSSQQPWALLSSTCQACAAGKYAESGASSCTDCPVGKYYESTGARSVSTCKDCLAGKFSTALGASSSSTCQACAAGKYAESGASSCTDCPVGKYYESTGARISIHLQGLSCGEVLNSPGRFLVIYSSLRCRQVCRK